MSDEVERLKRELADAKRFNPDVEDLKGEVEILKARLEDAERHRQGAWSLLGQVHEQSNLFALAAQYGATISIAIPKAEPPDS